MFAVWDPLSYKVCVGSGRILSREKKVNKTKVNERLLDKAVVYTIVYVPAGKRKLFN